MSNIGNIQLHYFNFPGRAGSIRDCLKISGIQFEDIHIAYDQFRELKETDQLPFGALPLLDLETAEGAIRSAQSNAILRFVGRMSALYPESDPIKALKVDEAMDLAEDIYNVLAPSMAENDEEKKLAMRKKLAQVTLPIWLGYLERLLVANGNTGFIVGDSLSVADLKLYWMADMFTNGNLDGVPTSILDSYKSIIAWRDNIAAERERRMS